MTLPAVDSWDLRGLKGPEYKVGPFCSNPECHRFAEHAHHIVRRSALGGDYAWVEVDGVAYANKTGLCPGCHDDITGRVGGHRAAIRLEQGLFVWCRVLLTSNGKVLEHVPVGELEPQPPTWEVALDGLELAASICPTCGHERRPSAPRHPQRKRKSWIVKVPADSEEDGAEVLDSLVSNMVPLIPNSNSSASGRYYVLVPVLAYSLMDSARFVHTMAGVGS